MHRLIQKISNSFWVVSIKQYYDKIKYILQYIKNMNKNYSNKVSTREYKKTKTKSKQILNFSPDGYPTGMQLFDPQHQDSFVSTVDCRNILGVGSATQGCRCRNRTLGHRPSLKQKVTQCDCRHIRPSTNSLLSWSHHFTFCFS